MATELKENNNPRINLNDEEVKVLQSIFKGNDALLQAIRAVMLGLTPTDEENKLVASTFANPRLQGIFRKRFLPGIDKTAPIGQVSDTWLGVETMVFGQHPDAIRQALEYKREAIIMTDHALERLVNPNLASTTTGLVLQYDPAMYPTDSLGIKLLARNQFIRHIEQQLLMIKLIAEQSTATDDSGKKKAKDSAR